MAAETLGSNETGYVLPNDNIPAIKQMILFGEPGEGNCDLYPLMTDFSVNKTTFNNSFNSCFGRETGRYTNKLYILPEYTISRYCNKSQQLTDDGCGFFSAVSVQQSEWFQETVRRDGSEYWFTLPDTPNTLYMTRLSVCNILGGNMELQRKHLGVLALSFDVSWVSSRIQTGALTQGSRVLIADMDGNGLFVSSGGEYLPREQVLALPEDEVVPLTAFGEECRVQKEVLNNQLMMLTVIPLSELRARTNDVLRVIVIAAAAVLAEPGGFLIAPRGWERVGDVSNVVFTNGAIARENGDVYLYYAASDTRLHVATTTVERLLDYAFHTPEDPLRSRDCVTQRCQLIDRNRAYLK